MASNSHASSIDVQLMECRRHRKSSINFEEENGGKAWTIQDNTEMFPTNAFGTLKFQGADVHTKKAEVSQKATPSPDDQVSSPMTTFL